jgi:hypothetical protein
MDANFERPSRYACAPSKLDVTYLHLENILACPLPENLLEWHYVILGPEGSKYEGN